jgi:hypothetical protein
VTDVSGGGIAVHRYSNLLIENCMIERVWTGIVVGSNGSDALIRGNIIKNTSGDGIYLKTPQTMLL